MFRIPEIRGLALPLFGWLHRFFTSDGRFLSISEKNNHPFQASDQTGLYKEDFASFSTDLHDAGRWEMGRDRSQAARTSEPRSSVCPSLTRPMARASMVQSDSVTRSCTRALPRMVCHSSPNTLSRMLLTRSMAVR